MHETTLVNNVVEIVLSKANEMNLEKILAVHLTVGRLRDISEELFEGLFGYLTRNTPAENAELVITRIPVTLRCKSCGYIFHFDAYDENTHQCPACREKNYEINSGLEFFINGIEAAPPSEESINKRVESFCA